MNWQAQGETASYPFLSGNLQTIFLQDLGCMRLVIPDADPGSHQIRPGAKNIELTWIFITEGTSHKKRDIYDGTCPFSFRSLRNPT
jgi:hypothetical protein